MRKLKRALVLALAAVSSMTASSPLLSPAFAQTTQGFRIEAGAKAPPVAGLTQSGQAADFNSLRGEKGLVLAFVRSADWCPFCQQQLKDLDTIADDLRARGFTLAALSYDSVEILDRFSKRHGVSYTLLSDPKSAVIDAFGVRNLEMAGKRMDGIPNPAIFIIAADGTVLDKLYEESYRKRPPTDLVLQRVDAALKRGR
jgi:peroxiredoxin